MVSNSVSRRSVLRRVTTSRSAAVGHGDLPSARRRGSFAREGARYRSQRLARPWRRSRQCFGIHSPAVHGRVSQCRSPLGGVLGAIQKLSIWPPPLVDTRFFNDSESEAELHRPEARKSVSPRELAEAPLILVSMRSFLRQKLQELCQGACFGNSSTLFSLNPGQ